MAIRIEVQIAVDESSDFEGPVIHSARTSTIPGPPSGEPEDHLEMVIARIASSCAEVESDAREQVRQTIENFATMRERGEIE